MWIHQEPSPLPNVQSTNTPTMYPHVLPLLPYKGRSVCFLSKASSWTVSKPVSSHLFKALSHENTLISLAINFSLLTGSLPTAFKYAKYYSLKKNPPLTSWISFPSSLPFFLSTHSFNFSRTFLVPFSVFLTANFLERLVYAHCHYFLTSHSLFIRAAVLTTPLKLLFFRSPTDLHRAKSNGQLSDSFYLKHFFFILAVFLPLFSCFPDFPLTFNISLFICWLFLCSTF